LHARRHYDPLQTDLAALEQAIEREFAALASLEAVAARSAIEIPVNYGGEHGPISMQSPRTQAARRRR
jgi:allophanate hydrolase subunit 1